MVLTWLRIAHQKFSMINVGSKQCSIKFILNQFDTNNILERNNSFKMTNLLYNSTQNPTKKLKSETKM